MGFTDFHHKDGVKGTNNSVPMSHATKVTPIFSGEEAQL